MAERVPPVHAASVTPPAPFLSIVIPALNEGARIDACLTSASPPASGGAPPEMIVVDGASEDDTVARAEPRANTLRAPRGRAMQMNAGARVASGEVLLFLHADSLLHPAGLDALRRALDDPEIVGGTFTLRFDEETPLLRAYAFFTRFRPRLFHYGDQGIFVRRSVFERLGGFREWPIMEDVDFLARLRGAGRTVLLPFPVTTSARRFRRHGIVRQQLLNAALVGCYMAGVGPARLARWYENVSR